MLLSYNENKTINKYKIYREKAKEKGNVFINVLITKQMVIK